MNDHSVDHLDILRGLLNPLEEKMDRVDQANRRRYVDLQEV